MSKIPADLHYTKEHEWVRLEGELAVVGITDYAQDSLGEVVFVELPAVGDSYEANDEIANVESVKAASAIYNPITGVVAEINEDLDDQPELINEDSYQNYLYKLSDFDLNELEELLDAQDYATFLESLD